MKKQLTIVHILTLSIISQFAQADIFKYTDDNGTVVMVDDESKIPKKYRKKSKITRSQPRSGVKTTGTTGGSRRVQVDNEGKQYAYDPDDCAYANFSKLDSELRKIGFMAGAGGGYVKYDDAYICSPCVKRINSRVPLTGNVLDVYEPANSLIYKYASGASYEYCIMSNRAQD